MSEPDVPAATSKQKIQIFWWKVLDALSTVAGLCIIAVAHWITARVLAFALGDGGVWKRYHSWVEAVTFGVFYAIYVFLLVEVLEIFWPRWLKRKHKS